MLIVRTYEEAMADVYEEGKLPRTVTSGSSIRFAQQPVDHAFLFVGDHDEEGPDPTGQLPAAHRLGHSSSDAGGSVLRRRPESERVAAEFWRVAGRSRR